MRIKRANINFNKVASDTTFAEQYDDEEDGLEIEHRDCRYFGKVYEVKWRENPADFERKFNKRYNGNFHVDSTSSGDYDVERHKTKFKRSLKSDNLFDHSASFDFASKTNTVKGTRDWRVKKERKEAEGNIREVNIVACGRREHHLITGKSNSFVKVFLNFTSLLFQPPVPLTHYLLVFQALGCPNPGNLSDAVWFSRHSDSAASIGCRYNEMTWKITCEGFNWVGDLDKNCPKEPPKTTSKSTTLSFWTHPTLRFSVLQSSKRYMQSDDLLERYDESVYAMEERLRERRGAMGFDFILSVALIIATSIFVVCILFITIHKLKRPASEMEVAPEGIHPTQHHFASDTPNKSCGFTSCFSSQSFLHDPANKSMPSNDKFSSFYDHTTLNKNTKDNKPPIDNNKTVNNGNKTANKSAYNTHKNVSEYNRNVVNLESNSSSNTDAFFNCNDNQHTFVNNNADTYNGKYNKILFESTPSKVSNKEDNHDKYKNIVSVNGSKYEHFWQTSKKV